MPENTYELLNQDIDTSFFTLEMTWAGIMDERVRNYIGENIPPSFEEIVKGTTVNTYMPAGELASFSKKCANTVLSDSKLLADLKEKSINAVKQMQDLALELNQKDFTKFDDQKIVQTLHEIRALQIDCTMFGTVIAFADVYGDVTNSLIEVVLKRENLSRPASEYVNELSMPDEPSPTSQAYEAIKKADVENEKEVLLKKFFWLDQGYVGRGLTEQQLREIAGHKKSEEQSVDKAELIAELDLSDKEKSMFEAALNLVEIKSARADARQFLYVIANRLLDILAQRQNIEARYLETLSVIELEQYLKGSDKGSWNLESRWVHSVLIPEENNYQVLLEDKAREYLEVHVKISNQENVLKIIGQTAYPGRVQGVVKKLYGAQHIKKVEEGDILVSPSTSPELLPAMKKAAAFVTDIGGITSHAAIVAREMKKPCVVGTRNASQILQDGDKIEVNADEGWLRKYER